MSTSDEHLKLAGELLANVFNGSAEMTAQHFTCTELDSLASAMLLLDRPEAARRLILGHVESDEENEGEDHFPDEGKDATEFVRDYVRYLAAKLGVNIHDDLDVPDDLANEPLLGSVRSSAAEIEAGDRVKVWGFTSLEAWGASNGGFQEGWVKHVYDANPDIRAEFGDRNTDGVPTVAITFTDDRQVFAVAYAVAYIIRD